MEKILFDSKLTAYKSKFGALKTNQKCKFCIDINKEEQPESATMCVRRDQRCDFSSYEMKKIGENGNYVRYSCEIALNTSDLYFYRFEFNSPNGVRYCGLKDGVASVGDWLSEWQLTVYDENFKTPDWAKNKVMYQLFTDRFSRSNNYMCRIAKNERVIKDDWSDVPEPWRNDFFMGNLDGVFSHTGADSLYFNKSNHYNSVGAFQGKESPYYNWYNFYDDGKRYECWWGFENLPNVNETHESFLEFITGDNGVLSYWQGMGAKGWRLDVADVPVFALFSSRDCVHLLWG